MDDQHQQRINRAAQEFTEALVAAYRTTADSSVVAQQLGAQQIEYFFDTVINNLRTQAEDTSQLTQQLADQQQLAREATRDLTQLSTDNYLDLLDSMFSFYQGGTSRTQRRTEEAQRRVEEAEVRAGEAQRRAEEAESSRSEAERQTEKAQKSARTAQKRAEEAERDLEEAKGRTEQAEERAREAERRAEEAQGRSQETERSLEEAQRRTLEAERRAQQAERSRSEALESQGAGSEEGGTRADAIRHPLSQWVRTSGRSKVRGRNTRSQGRSSRRR
jgi:chromosome segregation ATPase